MPRDSDRLQLRTKDFARGIPVAPIFWLPQWVSRASSRPRWSSRGCGDRRWYQLSTDGKLCGDVDFDACKDVAGQITPVPGGVGPMTITMLLANTIEAAERKGGYERSTNSVGVVMGSDSDWPTMQAAAVVPAISV